jgi:hypothetical protein
MSAATLAASPLTTSGAMYAGVPTTALDRVSGSAESSSALAKPKSSTFTAGVCAQLATNIALDGLRSR